MIRHLPMLLCLSFLAVSLGLAPPSHAVSVYDVILLSQKGFSESEILRILDATDSAFTITADDVIRLKRLGVGETVVRRMLVATPDERPDWKPVKNDEDRTAAPAEESGAADARYHHDDYEQTDAHSVVRRPEAAEKGDSP
ncbi:MAG: hypothetical protein Q8R92_00095 [Deltaproteobacteria bacterium]|nr:hypothetical protein [Deltaproteobacteria bacterium]